MWIRARLMLFVTNLTRETALLLKTVKRMLYSVRQCFVTFLSDLQSRSIF